MILNRDFAIVLTDILSLQDGFTAGEWVGGNMLIKCIYVMQHWLLKMMSILIVVKGLIRNISPADLSAG